MLLGEDIFVCGGQADQEVINFAECYNEELNLWEPINARMYAPRVGLGEQLFHCLFLPKIVFVP